MASPSGNERSTKRRAYAILGVLVTVGMVAGMALPAGLTNHLLPPTGTGAVTASGPATVSARAAPLTGGTRQVAAPSDPTVTFKETGLPFGDRWSVTAGLAGSIATGDLPTYDAVDTANGYVYVSDFNSSDVRVLNGASDLLVTSVPTLAGPGGVAFDSANGELYVTDTNSSNVSVIDGATDTVVATIPIGAPSASGIGFDAATGDVYVAMNSTNDVTIINGATNTVVVPSVRVGSEPLGVAVDTANGYVYVTNSGSNNVTVLNGTTDAHVASVHVGSGPRGIAFDGSNGYLYVVNYRSHNVTVINGATDHVVTSLPTGTDPQSAAFDPANGNIYVTVSSSDNVTVIDGATDQVVALVPVGSGPQGVAFDPANGHLFVVNYGSDNVTVINGATDRDVAPIFQSATGNYMVFQEPAGPLPYAISGPAGYGVSKVVGANRPGQSGATISANVTITATFGPLEPVTFDEAGLPNGTVWGVQLQSSLAYGGPAPQVIVSSRIGQDAYLGPSAVLATSAVGSAPVAMAIDPVTGMLYVSDSGSSVVSVVNGSSGQVVGSVPVTGQPEGLAFDGANGYLFVVSTGSVHRVTVIEAAINAVLKTVHLPAAPESIAFDPANGFLYVTLSSGVEVINATSDATVATIPAGTDPSGVAVDAANGYVYVANAGSDNVTVINGTSDSLVGAIPTGSAPGSIVLDSTNGDLYVTNMNSSNLSVIAPASGRVVANVPVGSQPFGAAYDSANGCLYVANNGSNNVTVVDGANDLAIGSIPVGDAPQAALFVGGSDHVFVADSGSNAVSVVNGSATDGGVTLHFTVVKDPWKYSLTTKPSTYAASPGHGALGVGTHAVTKVIKFKLVGQTVVFHRTGAGVPGPWGINITGPENVSLLGSTASLKVVLANGTYGFTAWNFSAEHPHPASGTFTVVAPHSAQTITISYTSLPQFSVREPPAAPEQPPRSPEMAGVLCASGRPGH